MRNISTVGDNVTTVHVGCDLTTKTIGGATNVYVGLLPVILNGDSNVPHTLMTGDKCLPHPAPPTVTAQQITVYANGRPVVGALDSYAGCGMIDVSPKTVFIP